MLFNTKLSLGCIFIITTLYAQPASPQESKTAVIGSNKSLMPLIDAALRDPNVQRKTISEKFAKDFGLPSSPDELWVYQLATKPIEGHMRVLFIRPRDLGRTDFFLIDAVENKEAFYYYTTTDGNLIRATHADGQVRAIPIEVATKGFESELAFWQSWLDSLKVSEASK